MYCQDKSDFDAMWGLLFSCPARRYPDGAVLCVLALDEEDEDDAALQIHFKLLQAFCYDNYLDILRVTGMRRLAQLLEETSNRNESRDLHCILVTVSPNVHSAPLHLSNFASVDSDLFSR